ncbi:hypothetical protein NW754_005734 [Fusarium falciforme]|nr:hypothetical protein NW754_005734 [Fusarium falciforme]
MRKFKFQSYLESIERFKATALQTVPPILVMLAKRPETYRYDLSSVKHIVTGAAPLSTELQNEVSRRFNLVVTQGKKELIKVNGLQVSPAELESVLLEHEAVADAAVVGMSIFEKEKPRAYIVLQALAKGKVTGKDVELFVASRVAKHKALSGGVQVVDEIPRLASGKIIRKLMKEWGKRDAREMERWQKEKL